MLHAKHTIEYVTLRIVAFIVNVLPYRAALAVGYVLAWFGFYVFRFRVREAKRRIREVFGDALPQKRINQVAWLSFRNMCFNVVESLRMRKINADWVKKYVFHDEVMRVIRLNGAVGGIIAIPHMGNWDLAGVGMSAIGAPLFAVARRQKNPLVTEYIDRMRGLTGTETIHNDRHVLRRVLRNLKAGKLLAIVPDVRSRKPGEMFDFLGGKASLGMGAAVFARQANVGIYPSLVTRIGWTQHRWRVLDPIMPDLDLDKDADCARMMKEMLQVLEGFILEAPEQYFWYNSRWVLEPFGGGDQ